MIASDIVYTSTIVSALSHVWLTNIDQWRWCAKGEYFQFWDMDKEQIIEGRITHTGDKLVVNIEIPCPDK